MPELDQAQVDALFAQFSGEIPDKPSCCCEMNDHHEGQQRWCGREAKVQLLVHVVHVCRHPGIRDRVDGNGCTTQLMCIECWQFMQVAMDNKIAQTRARCTTLSTSCRRCGHGLALRAPAEPGGLHLLHNCPRCGQERIHFEPVCGGGVYDSAGTNHGCGAKLDTHNDIIREVKWLDEMGIV